jgi:hypothetical protein
MEAMIGIFEIGAVDGRWMAEQTRHPDTTTLRQIKCHTMQSNFASKLLKTKDRHPNKVTHFFEPAFANQTSDSGQQGRHGA